MSIDYSCETPIDAIQASIAIKNKLLPSSICELLSHAGGELRIRCKHGPQRIDWPEDATIYCHTRRVDVAFHTGSAEWRAAVLDLLTSALVTLCGSAEFSEV